MHTARTLDGFGDMLDPASRVVAFADEPHIVTVVTHCRSLWITDPAIASREAADPGKQALGDKELEPFRVGSELHLEDGGLGYTDAPRNPDTANIDTKWRKKIHEVYAHVFYDVMNFLSSVNCNVGHYHPPRHKTLAVPFPAGNVSGIETGTVAQASICQKFGTNMLLIPTFLAPGVTIRATTQDDQDDQERELGIFDMSDSHKFELWYLRQDVTLRIYVEGSHAKDSNDGFAAVMVLGELCSDAHDQPKDCGHDHI